MQFVTKAFRGAYQTPTFLVYANHPILFLAPKRIVPLTHPPTHTHISLDTLTAPQYVIVNKGSGAANHHPYSNQPDRESPPAPRAPQRHCRSAASARAQRGKARAGGGGLDCSR